MTITLNSVKEVSLYLLYDHYYPLDDEGGAESYPVAAVVASNRDDANVMFAKMGFKVIKYLEVRDVPMYNIEGTMFKFPDCMLPF